MKSIKTIKQLAEYINAAHPTPESIAYRLYKDTLCGISFTANETGITVAGFVEGDAGECPLIHLKWGFTQEEFDKAIKQADKDGCELWETTYDGRD